MSPEPEPQTLRKAAMRDVPFNWEDPLCLDELLTGEERMIRDCARASAQQSLLPRILRAHRHEDFAVAVMKEMAELGLLGATIAGSCFSMCAGRPHLRKVTYPVRSTSPMPRSSVPEWPSTRRIYCSSCTARALTATELHEPQYGSHNTVGP